MDEIASTSHTNDVESQMEDIFGNITEEPFGEDSGSEYLPSRSPSPTSVDLVRVLAQTPSDERSENVNQRKSRKRVRNEKKWKKNVRKEKRAKGEEYSNVRGNIVPSKHIDTTISCSCILKCHEKIAPAQQKKLFESFYALENFNLQTSYIFSLVKVYPKKRCLLPRNRDSSESRRSYTRTYQVPNADGIPTTVCKTFFKKIFAVSDGRLTRVLSKKLSQPTPPLDKRGKHVPANKTSDTKIQIVKDFINRFPKYDSHYTIHKSLNRQYLAPDLNLTKMYSLYCNETESERVSYFMFRKIFNEQFNLSFHPPISDSCKKCDKLKIKIDAAETQEEKNRLSVEKQLHLTKAASARENYKKDKEYAEKNSDVTVIVFDLMKTLPTPVLSTGICYYKRQLWTYCLGIHNVGNDDVVMAVWDESSASRGPQEIGSCLLRYIKENVKTSRLIMYSDQCGGQNRNIKMALLCQYITCHPDFCVKHIDHKFFVSGHSYLACDQDFGLIEKKKKFFQNIFVPDDWINVIKAGRNKNPFKIMKMKKEDFFSTKKLENNVTNRKMTTEKSKVQWINFQWISYHEANPFSIFFKYSNNEEVLFQSVNIKKRNSKNMSEILLDILYPDGRAISVEKKKDLIELMCYVPPIYHSFYADIKESATVGNTLDIVGVDANGEEA